MNLQNFGSSIEEAEMTEDSSVQFFLESFKRKTRFNKSLFEHSFTQKLNPISMVNYQDHHSCKFLEFTTPRLARELASEIFLRWLNSVKKT